MMATGQPLAEVLDALARAIEAQLRDAHCTVLLLDRADGTLHTARRADDAALLLGGDRGGEPSGRTWARCGTAAFRCEPVIVEDIAADPLWDGWHELARGTACARAGPCRSWTAAGDVLGTFALYRGVPHVPGARERALVSEATRLAGIAIAAAARRGRAARPRARARDAHANVPDVIVALRPRACDVPTLAPR